MCNKNCGNCNECNPCDKSCKKQDCGCKFEVDAACVRYTKKNLSCIGRPKGTTLEDIIDNLEEKICNTGPGGECECQEVNVVAGDNVNVEVTNVGGVTTYTVSAECCPNLNTQLVTQPTACGQASVKVEVTGGSGSYTYEWTSLVGLTSVYNLPTLADTSIIYGQGTDTVVFKADYSPLYVSYSVKVVDTITGKEVTSVGMVSGPAC